MAMQGHELFLDCLRPLNFRGGRSANTILQQTGIGAPVSGRYRRSLGRSRDQGSPFSAHLGTSQSRPGWISSVTARGGGEVIPVRSTMLAWPLAPGINHGGGESVEQSTPGQPRVPSPFTPLTDNGQNAGREPSDGITNPSFDVPENVRTLGELKLVPMGVTADERGHRRRVTWAGTIETREVERTAPSDVLSPDLHALVIAQQLAVAANAPKVALAAQAVLIARREVAAVVRSLSANDGWSGSLDGVEDEWRSWSRREFLSMRETDELVRGVVSRQQNIAGGGNHEEVYRLKDAYRAARRRMDDASAD